MKILVASSEATPFAKTGGLADVCGALPGELGRLGQDAALIMPAHRSVFQSGVALEPLDIQLTIPIGRNRVEGEVLRGYLPLEPTKACPKPPKVPVYFIKQDEYFDRDGLYGVSGADYRDNCERFVFFSRAVLETIRALRLEVDVLHVNDWQTGLIPALLKIEYRTQAGFENIRTLLTVHNLAYQGTFWHWDMLLTGLDWKYFNWQQMEFFGNLNFLKTALVFSDAINTVSPRYAEEIQSSPLGCGLEGVLQQRRASLSGIINGVDYTQWDPQIDTHLIERYTPETVVAGKAANKRALQQELGFAVDSETPLVAFVGRLVEQKGIDLIASVLHDRLQNEPWQWVVLGTGEPRYQEQLGALASRYPQRLATRFEFSDSLAHRIEAAADIFLMPSRFEPCGLSQLYSLKYGTVPLVRSTGGLADTVTDTHDATLAAGTATGFSFREHSTLAFNETLSRAIDAYRRPEVWRAVVANGMKQDWSWSKSAGQYIDLYRRLVARV